MNTLNSNMLQSIKVLIAAINLPDKTFQETHMTTREIEWINHSISTINNEVASVIHYVAQAEKRRIKLREAAIEGADQEIGGEEAKTLDQVKRWAERWK